jgi:bacillopeptidase F
VFILKKFRFMAWAVIIFLLLSLCAPLPRVTAGAEKIHPLVTAQAEQRFVPILIKLSQQADPEAAARSALAQTAAGDFRARKLVSGQAVVQALRDVAASSQKELLAILNTAACAGRARNIKSFYIVNLVSAEVHPSLIPALARRSDIQAILPNTRISRARSEVAGTQATSAWNLEMLGVPSLHRQGIRGEGVVVGIIDTGVDYSHPDLRDGWRGQAPSLGWLDVVNGRELPYDDDGHGTHVAGIIAGTGGTGVAPAVSWIAAKAFDEFGDANSDWLLRAGEYMLAPVDAAGNPHPELAPDIINNSWGREAGMDEWFRPMVQAWRAAGILPVFAAGNGSGAGSIYNPANYPESLSVASVDRSKKRSSFSSQGPAPYPEIIKPDLVAPGENIPSTKAGGGYGLMSGTSMATPHVAGVAALLLAENPALEPDSLEAALRQTAQPLTDARHPDSPNHSYGWGLVKADAALALGRNGVGIIQGRVSTPIPDAEAPVITHAPVHEYYEGASLPIYVDLEDQLGIVRAEVIVWDGAGQEYLAYPLALVDGDKFSGRWLCWLPFDLVVPPSLEYSIHAENRAGLVSSSGPHLVGLIPGLIPPYTTEFGQFPLGWIWDGDWEWGRGKSSPQPQYGQALFGTKLGGSYSPDSWSSLYAPPFDLRGISEPVLRFVHWFDLAPGDTAQVIVSTDNLASWDVLATFTGASSGWQTYKLDLSAWENCPTPVIVGFDLLARADGGGRPGWFIDLFSLEVGGEGKVQSQAATSLQYIEGPGSIPLEATVTILETQATTRTGYADGIFAGSFLILYPAGSGEELTLRVEAPGYRPWQQEVLLSPGETVELDITLEPLSFSFLRLSGSNRYATAAAVSREGWSQAETVVLARGDDNADALAGVPLAAALDAPILLTSPDMLPEVTRQELTRLGTKEVYLLGGNGAISPAVETVLTQELSLGTQRIFGANRYATAAEIARRLAEFKSFDAAVIAYGGDFPDALAAAPFAASLGMPILLTQTAEVPVDTAQALAELGITRTFIAGGTGVVSNAVHNQLPLPLRLEGQNRYHTAVALAEYFRPQTQRLYLATGRDFADAISGAGLAARDNAALLLVGDVVPYPVSQFILRHGSEEIRLLGGEAAISQDIVEAIEMLAAQP